MSGQRINLGGLIIGRFRIPRRVRRPRRVVVPPTVTTTVTSAVGSAGATESHVIDISVIPFLRQIDLQYVGHSMRPQRRVYYYFDDTDVTTYIQRGSVISISGSVNINDVLGNSDRITYLSNSALVLNATVNPDTGNTDIFVANVVGTFPVGVTVTGTKSGLTGTIVTYQHRHGTANTGGANSITLAPDASSVTGSYIGNTVYFCAGSGAGQTGVITQYAGATRVANVTTNWTVLPTSNTRYSIGDHFIERDGSVAGMFILPNQPGLRFGAGERIFRIIDNPNNSIPAATARADFRWLGNGLTEVKRNITIQVPTQVTPPPPAPVTPAPVPAPRAAPPRRRDPVAQTFFIDEGVYAGGLFVTAVDLFFATKDPILPITVQLRPVVNGFPHSTDSLKGGELTVYPQQINTSTLPNTGNVSTATTCTFPAPVYLEPGLEYALVVLTDSLDYNIYVAELGKTVIGSTRVVSTQPYLGSFFKSQNGSTWTPIQEEDLMFVLKKAVFTVNTPGTIDFYNQVPTANLNVDTIYVYTSEDNHTNTSTGYMTSTDVGVTYANVITKQTYDLDSRFIIPATTDGVFRVRGSLSTEDRNLSPVIWTEKLNIIASENIINDLPLTNDSITIVNGGTGYQTNANISIIIGGGGGTGANAKADQITGGVLTSIIMNAVGSGYTGQANIIVFGGTAGTNAVAVFASETRPEGGPGVAKYITRVVTLAEGFDAGDLRAYVTAYKPSGTDIHLYYKIKNNQDPDTFASKPWTLMTQKTAATLYSDDKEDLIEYEYRASSNVGSVTYSTAVTTYDRFQQFAFKAVLRATNTSIVPMCYDFRAMALPPSGI